MKKYLLPLATLLAGGLGLALCWQNATKGEQVEAPMQEPAPAENMVQQRTPIEGAWQPDLHFFLQSQAQRGVKVTPKQEKKLARAMAKMRLIITANTLTFVYPNINGTYTYTSQPATAGCMELTADQLGHLKLCRKEAQLELSYPASGKTERLNRI